MTIIGMSSCFIDRIETNKDGTLSLYIKFDFIITILPPRTPAKIDLAKTRSLIPWLTQNKGINWRYDKL